MLAPLVRTYPELAEDHSLRQGLRRSTDTNLSVILHVLAGNPPSSAGATEDHLRFARILSRRHVPLETVLESYHVGEEILRRLLLDEIASRADDARDLADAVRIASDQIAHHVSRTVAAVIAEYQNERESWMGESIARRTDVVRSLIRGDRVDVELSERVIGYPLRTHHLGGILWSGGPETSERSTSRISRQLAEDFGAHGQLSLPAGPAAAWLWFAVEDSFDAAGIHAAAAEHLPENFRMVLGRVCANEQGFGRTHAQALRAERIATQRWTSARVITYGEVEALTLIAQDPASTDEFVQHTLGALAADAPGLEELRRTLAVYLDADANARRAAERLHVHKNTVLYRIRRAESLLGRSVDGHRMALSMALLAVSRGPDG